MYGLISSLEEELSEYLNSSLVDSEYVKYLNLNYEENNMVLLCSLCEYCVDTLQQKYETDLYQYSIHNLKYVISDKGRRNDVDNDSNNNIDPNNSSNVLKQTLSPLGIIDSNTNSNANNNTIPTKTQNNNNNNNNNNYRQESVENSQSSKLTPNANTSIPNISAVRDPISGSHPFWQPYKSTRKPTVKLRGNISLSDYRQSLPAYTEKYTFLRLLSGHQVSKRLFMV